MDEVLEAIQMNPGEIPKIKKKFSLVKTLNQVIELNRTQSPEPQQWCSANNLRYKLSTSYLFKYLFPLGPIRMSYL
ncbi:TPA: hypothetical protein JAJ32_001439 [Legionella pneumophila]|nr:hypothetical protein [Legionella pneumophila]HCJ1124979.1 hypothetical protein [Legionella pneumophila]HEL9657794.1 hypothetical protein [Legionella pneumophila]HEL9658118.1 hypothetical protein [Legionella pneumophila]HEM6937130.1 hypothetical protein [Legionella pneumophila]